MQNDPKWPEQMWVIPAEWAIEWPGQLQRHGNKWEIVYCYGAIRVPVDAEDALKMHDAIVAHYKEEYRREKEQRQ